MALVARHWDHFIAHYTTEGCSNPHCLVCKRNKDLKAEMVRLMGSSQVVFGQRFITGAGSL